MLDSLHCDEIAHNYASGLQREKNEFCAAAAGARERSHRFWLPWLGQVRTTRTAVTRCTAANSTGSLELRVHAADVSDQ